MKSISQLLLLIVVLLFNQCGSKNADSTAPASAITLSVDGVTKSISISSALLLIETTGDKGRTLNVSALSGTNSLILTISNWAYQSPPTNGLLLKSYYEIFASTGLDKATCQKSTSSGASLCDAATATYVIGSDSYFSSLYDGPDYDSKIKITANDTNSKTISGEFDLKLQNANDLRLSVKGTFTNVTYLVK